MTNKSEARGNPRSVTDTVAQMLSLASEVSSCHIRLLSVVITGYEKHNNNSDRPAVAVIREHILFFRTSIVDQHDLGINMVIAYEKIEIEKVLAEDWKLLVFIRPWREGQQETIMITTEGRKTLTDAVDSCNSFLSEIDALVTRCDTLLR